MKDNSKKGFSLVETLVVIVIIGVLASVAVFKLGPIKDKSEEEYLKLSARQILNGIYVYKEKLKTFPTVPAGTPEERINVILEAIDDDRIDFFAYNENRNILLAAQEYSRGDFNSNSVKQMFENFDNIRGRSDSGDPSTKEIIVLPEGEIVYPTEIKLQVKGDFEG